jgi:hypothetical protein
VPCREPVAEVTVPVALSESGRRDRLGVPLPTRLTAPTMTLIASARMTRSAIICPVTMSRAASVLAVMSPNPTVENTVENTVTVKVQRVGAGQPGGEAARGEPGHDVVGAGEQRQEQRHTGGERLGGPQARER